VISGGDGNSPLALQKKRNARVGKRRAIRVLLRGNPRKVSPRGLFLLTLQGLLLAIQHISRGSRSSRGRGGKLIFSNDGGGTISSSLPFLGGGLVIEKKRDRKKNMLLKKQKQLM